MFCEMTDPNRGAIVIYDHAECARFLIPRYRIDYFISAHM